METLAPIVACSSDNKDVVLVTESQGASKGAIRFVCWRLLPSANVDDVSAFLDSPLDSPSEIQLKEAASTPFGISKDRNEQTSASGRDAKNRTVPLAKDDARNMCPVSGHRPATSLILHQRDESPEIGTAEAGMGEIRRSVDHCNADGGVAKRLTLE